MMLTKVLGSALLAAVAAMALVGVGSAAAQEHRVVFCKVEAELCPEGKAWPDETLFLAETLGAPVVLGTVPVKCEESHLAGLTLGTPERNSLLVDIELLSLTGSCTECPKAVVESLPYIGHIDHKGENKYVLAVLSPLVQFHECPLVGLCGYNAEEIQVELKNAEGNVLGLIEEAPLARHSGSIFCGESRKMDFHYVNLLPVAEHGGESLGNAWLSLLDRFECG